VVDHLTIEVLTPARSGWRVVETALLVNGHNPVASGFDNGPMADPDDLLGPHGLLQPAAEPRQVRLAEAECTEDCCGAVWMRLRREADLVIWDQWRVEGVATETTFRFAAAQYSTELDRADAERDWEWPGRTVARLIRTALLDDPAILGRWRRRLEWIVCRANEPETVHLSHVSTNANVHGQGLLELRVTDATPAEQAARTVERLRDYRPW
jgi:hypothetical protein